MAKVQYVHGASSAVETAKSEDKIHAYDILFLDGETAPTIGWLDKNGETRIVDTKKIITVDDESLPVVGEEGKIYIFEKEAYFWDAPETKFQPLSKSVDVTDLEAKIETKVDEAKVLELIEQQSGTIVEIIEI